MTAARRAGCRHESEVTIARHYGLFQRLRVVSVAPDALAAKPVDRYSLRKA
jgi:hypothetical protein